MSLYSYLKDLLSKKWVFAIWASTALFLAYFCMYMFRKPYTAGTFSEMEWMGIDLKIVLVISQVLGYALSKFLGIKVISELRSQSRIKYFLGLIFIAWLALLGFATTPTSYGFAWMFFNGLPLGMIWGIVFSFCEGRKFTEVLTVILSANFILSSGIAKSLGMWVLGLGFSEQVMPIIVGTAVLPLLLLSLWMLSVIPEPSEEDKLLRTPRKPMDNMAKKKFLSDYWLPLLLFVMGYLVLTIIRDIRDNFAVELWTNMGYIQQPEIFSTTELPVTIIVLMSLGLLYRIHSNALALKVNILIFIFGIALIIVSTTLFTMEIVSPVVWMISSGVGLFLPYILMNGIIFDRFIANYRIIGNVGFIMYISDAFGYLGSISVMIFKNFGSAEIEWLTFYTNLCIFGGIIALLLGILLMWYVLSNEFRQEYELNAI